MNFSKAAVELNTTQSTLSKHIAALEAELGFSLVARGGELRLTPKGAEFLNAAQRVLALYDSEVERLKRVPLSTRPARLLWFDYAPQTSFARQLEGIPHTFVSSRGEESFFSAILSGAVDMCLTADISIDEGWLRKARQSGIDVVSAGRSAGAVLVSSSHPLAKKHSLRREDLRGMKLLVVAGGPFDDWVSWVGNYLGGDIEATPVFKPIDGNPRNLASIDLDDGVFIMSRSFIDQPALEGRVVFEHLDGKPIELPVCILYRHGETNPNVLQLVERFKDNPALL